MNRKTKYTIISIIALLLSGYSMLTSFSKFYTSVFPGYKNPIIPEVVYPVVNFSEKIVKRLYGIKCGQYDWPYVSDFVKPRINSQITCKFKIRTDNPEDRMVKLNLINTKLIFRGDPKSGLNCEDLKLIYEIEDIYCKLKTGSSPGYYTFSFLIDSVEVPVESKHYKVEIEIYERNY